MAFTLYSLLQAALLCVNAIAVLHEERFLKNNALNQSREIGKFLSGKWSLEAEKMILTQKFQIVRLNATKIEPITTEDLTSWITSAFSFFKEWVGVGIFAACCVSGIALCLWLVLRMRRKAQNDRIMFAQALMAVGNGDSPQLAGEQTRELVDLERSQELNLS